MLGACSSYFSGPIDRELHALQVGYQVIDILLGQVLLNPIRLDRGNLEEAFAGFDHDLRDGVIDSVLNGGPGVMFNQWEAAEAPTYYRKSMCMIGDAAHATTPWCVLEI